MSAGNVTVKIVFEPWAAVYIALMVKLGRSEKFRGTLATFVLDNAVKVI